MLLGEHLTRIARDMNEPDNTFPLSSYTRKEMIWYTTRSEFEFVYMTGCFVQDLSVAVPAGSPAVVQRPGCINNITRVSFDGRNLDRQSLADFDKDDRRWRERVHSGGKPTMYHEDQLPAGVIELDKMPLRGGVVRFFGDKGFDNYLTDADNEGDLLATDNQEMHLGDYWEQYIRWRTLSHVFFKETTDRDTIRGRYALQRFMVGVVLARSIMKGSEANVEFRGGIPE